jgi:hypothetical protein
LKTDQIIEKIFVFTCLPCIFGYQRISSRQPQLCWWSHWPPDLHFGRQKQNLVAQATILVDNIEL